MIKRLLALIVGVLLLAGCAQITEGYIIEKTFEEEYTYTTTECQQWGYVTTGYDEDGYPIRSYRCLWYGPEEHYVPPSWSFTIQGEDEDGKTQQATYQVDLDTYNSYEVGDYYDHTPEDGSNAPGTNP